MSGISGGYFEFVYKLKKKRIMNKEHRLTIYEVTKNLKSKISVLCSIFNLTKTY